MPAGDFKPRRKRSSAGVNSASPVSCLRGISFKVEAKSKKQKRQSRRSQSRFIRSCWLLPYSTVAEAMDPTTRFSTRVADYARHRPGYPAQIVETLQRECGLTRDSVIADIGCGTGLLAKL